MVLVTEFTDSRNQSRNMSNAQEKEKHSQRKQTSEKHDTSSVLMRFERSKNFADVVAAFTTRGCVEISLIPASGSVVAG